MLAGMEMEDSHGPESIALREAAVEDLPRLVQLTRDFYAEDGFSAAENDLIARFGTFLSQSDANVTVATTPLAIVGFALTTMRLILESGIVAELQDLYVQREHRGKGIGTMLIREAARWARANSAASLEVVIAPNERDVTHLHRYNAARGFVDEGRRLIHVDL